MFDEGTQKPLGALNAAAMLAGSGSQCGQIVKGGIGQGIGFEVGPEELDRVEFRCVGREEQGVKTGLALEELLRAAGAMRIEPIPQQEDRVGQFPQQIPEKSDHLWPANVGVHMQTEIQSEAFS